MEKKMKRGMYNAMFMKTMKKFSEFIEKQQVKDAERFEWPVSSPVGTGEVLTLQLLSRGRWGHPRVLGVYRLGLQILVADGQLFVTDTLVDNNNKAVPVSNLLQIVIS
ncbi:unnamed protein product [Diatraea saccharalis]|uniref:Uncharacterized protein n=1 Tax=Diatraea saccharalis TaxID=40085 RepID=A0A9N9MZC6_9NEOP|nr:unnamed protein product [Diatraea saccharalis]